MRVLVTGGTGFLGRYIVEHLHLEGYRVDTLGRSASADIQADLSVCPPDLEAAYDLVVHAAGKAHVVPDTEEEKLDFFRVNASGTRHLLDALTSQRPDAFVLVSTIAVYGCESGEDLCEATPRKATDPYGLSRRQAEDMVTEWGEAHGVRVAILRLPLVAGAGAPGNLGAMVHAMRRGVYLGIGAGGARRSVVLADDVASILVAASDRGGTYNLTDGRNPSFAEIEKAVADVLGSRPPLHLPRPIAALGARVGDLALGLTGRRLPLTSRTLGKMTTTLTMSDALARRNLGWSPHSVTEAAPRWVPGTT